MGAGIHGGFGNTKGYKDILAMSATIVNTKRIGELLDKYAKNIKEEKGFYDLIMHGKEDSFLLYRPDKNTNKRESNLKGWADISHRNIAQYIKKDKTYNGTAIRLISCSTGKQNKGVAQNLANKLGVLVKAPNKTLYIKQNGDMYIGDNPFDNSGKWEKFYPQKRRK